MISTLAVFPVAASVAAVAVPSHHGQPAASCPPAYKAEDPVAVAVAFVAQGISGADVAKAFALSADAYRHGESCAEWVAAPPFTTHKHIDWNISSYQEVAAGTGQEVLRVILRFNDTQAPQAFLLEVDSYDGEHWQIGDWVTDEGVHPSVLPVEAGYDQSVA